VELYPLLLQLPHTLSNSVHSLGPKLVTCTLSGSLPVHPRVEIATDTEEYLKDFLTRCVDVRVEWYIKSRSNGDLSRAA
jgi:hypothetical protein